MDIDIICKGNGVFLRKVMATDAPLLAQWKNEPLIREMEMYIMNLEIKPFTPELADDYFDFHENRAFLDHPEWSHCYCLAFCMQKTDDIEMSQEVKANGGGRAALHRALKTRAKKYVADRTLKGYVAYADGLLVGWCNANDKADYTRFDFDEEVSNFIRNTGNGRIKAINCFCIAPEYRGKGVATALLERVCEDAKTDGYTAVEGYPRLHDKLDPFDYTGPTRLYEKAGFIMIAQQEKVVIMRKELELAFSDSL
ncbi:MAG: GNAT family N-acetyltransferase [Desulfitobacteriaceae bacterium]|nr:GNAT family N-acetyltransferase [Desulfitobacteriaceae bacterium]